MRLFNKILFMMTAACVVLPVAAMPVGLRTAVWGVSAANGHAAVQSLLPEAGGEAGVSQTLAAFSDPQVAANIADETEYEEFRSWALESGARADALTTSSSAYLSFATASPVLVGNPQPDDLVIDGMGVADAGEMELVIALDGVNVGRNATDARLKTVFGVEGGATLDASSFSADNLDFSLSPTEDGRVRAIVAPKRDAGGNFPKSFFIQTKLK